MHPEHDAQRFPNHPVKLADGSPGRHAFAEHCAGPFGDDVPGDWMSGDAFFPVLAIQRLGWRDIHATNTVAATASARTWGRLARLYGRWK